MRLFWLYKHHGVHIKGHSEKYVYPIPPEATVNKQQVGKPSKNDQVKHETYEAAAIETE